MKEKILYFIIGVLFSLVLLLSINAWKPSTGTYSSAVSICASNDGKIVYVTDSKGVQKSEDGGKTWKFILTK